VPYLNVFLRKKLAKRYLESNYKTRLISFYMYFQCVVIDLTSQLDPEIILDPDWGEYWDLCLQRTSESYSVDSYDEENNNCFIFILVKFLA